MFFIFILVMNYVSRTYFVAEPRLLIFSFNWEPCHCFIERLLSHSRQLISPAQLFLRLQIKLLNNYIAAVNTIRAPFHRVCVIAVYIPTLLAVANSTYRLEVSFFGLWLPAPRRSSPLTTHTRRASHKGCQLPTSTHKYKYLPFAPIA